MIRWWVVSCALLFGCGETGLPYSPSTGDDGSATDSTSSASSGTTEDSTSGGETDGQSAECTACYGGFCQDEIDACAAETECACLIECDIEDCEATCGTSDLFVQLFSCIADSSVGTCAYACGNECEACVYLDCTATFQACFGEPSCVCKLQCGEDSACVDACAASTEFDPLTQCILDAGAGECAAPCGG